MQFSRGLALSLVAATLGFAALHTSPAISRDETTAGKMSTSDTQDIINTLRKRGAFHKMLEGTESAFDIDNKLKGKGPYTVFACDDKGWAKLNQADQDTLFNNKKKLAQVFNYEIITGQALDSESLGKMQSVKSSEGHDIAISSRKAEGHEKGGLYVDKARIKVADLRCTNGIIHITDVPIMPPLAQ